MVIRRAVAFAVCLLASVVVAYSEQPYRPAVALAAVFPAEGADPELQSVLAESLLVHLAQYRVTPILAETSAGGPPALGELRSLAHDRQADYIVLGRYRTQQDTLELEIAVYDAEGENPLATGSASGRISLTLDTLAGRALGELMPGLATSFPAGQQAAWAAPAAAATATAVEPPARAPDAVVTTAPGTGQVRWRRVEVSVGGAPFVTTGSIAGYAKIGVLSTAAVGARFPAGRGAISAGLLAGAAWLRAAGSAVADVVLAPIGPDLRWTVPAASSPAVSLHLCGGPAVIVAITSWAGPLAKVAPCVLGGLDVDVALTPSLGLRIDADYAVFFEGSMVVQGFAPQLSLRARF